MSFDVNYIAIVVAAVVSCFIGTMWHGPVFGKQWMSLMKVTPAQMKKGQQEMAGKMHWYFLSAFIQQIVLAFVISVLARTFGVLEAMDAVTLGFWLWLGPIAMTLLSGVLWEERSIPLYLFGIAYQFVSIMVMTLIVGLWL